MDTIIEMLSAATLENDISEEASWRLKYSEQQAILHEANTGPYFLLCQRAKISDFYWNVSRSSSQF